MGTYINTHQHKFAHRHRHRQRIRPSALLHHIPNSSISRAVCMYIYLYSLYVYLHTLICMQGGEDS